MTIFKKREDAIAEKNEDNACACPMMDFIAKLVAIDFDESEEFEYDSPHTVLTCDLVFKLFKRGEYKEAMEALAAAFLMTGMDSAGELMAVASSGYTERSGKLFMERFFEYSDMYETYMLGRELFIGEEVTDDEDDSGM